MVYVVNCASTWIEKSKWHANGSFLSSFQLGPRVQNSNCEFCQSKSLSRPPPDTWRGPYPGPAAEDTWNQQESTSCDSFCRTELLHSLFRRFCDFEMFLWTKFEEHLMLKAWQSKATTPTATSTKRWGPHGEMADGKWLGGFKLFRSHLPLATRSTGAKWSWRRQHCGDAGWSQNTKLWYFLQFFSRGFLLFLLCKESKWI